MHAIRNLNGKSTGWTSARKRDKRRVVNEQELGREVKFAGSRSLADVDADLISATHHRAHNLKQLQNR